MQKKTWETILVWILALALFGSGGYYLIKSRAATKAYDYNLTEVAAVVDGVDVLEADVAYTINTMRSNNYGTVLANEEWAQTLKNGGYTPETLREYVIKNQFAVPIMVLTDAAELGIYPDETAIDLRITEQKDAFGSDSAWMNYLHAMGFASEDAYRRLFGAQDVVDSFLSTRFADSDPTPEEIDDYLRLNAPYVAGKRSSAVIVEISEDNPYDSARSRINRALSAVNSGVDFATVADSYSVTTSELKKGGDLGWEALTNLPSEYYTALSELEVGEVSGIIESRDSLFIIYCTDEFVFNEDDFDPASMPEDLRESILDTLPSYLDDNRPSKYFEALLESEDRIVIHPMPSGLPYDVDMSSADAELEIIDDVVGTGPEAQVGDLIRVTYIGTLEDGTVFDASALHDGYYEFVLGKDSVIEGWQQGLVGMRVGGTRTLIIPPHLAYGSSGSSNGSIPPNATLTFVIELLSVNGDFGDVDNPSGADSPDDGSPGYELPDDSLPLGEGNQSGQ